MTDLRQPSQKSKLPKSELFDQVAQYAAESLTKRTKRYLAARGITSESIRRWQLGYFPRDMLSLFGKINPVLLREHGLVYSAQTGPLQRRITFPIRNQRKEVVAIAGRPPITEDERRSIGIEPKYWHNAFKKGKVLYGLHIAKDFIRQQKTAIVTEGQFDVIVGHQMGIKNLVCPCGTALTEHHLLLLARYAQRILVVFDGDDAGHKVAEKIREQQHKGLDIRIIPLPRGYDLDLYLRTFGAESFHQLISHTDFADHIMNKLKH